jgi:hypothetical protein
LPNGEGHCMCGACPAFRFSSVSRIFMMPKKKEKRAVKAVEKAVKKAVRKGVPEKAVERAVDRAIEKGNKRKKAGDKKASKEIRIGKSTKKKSRSSEERTIPAS